MTNELSLPTPNRGGRPKGRTAPASDAVRRVRTKLDITQAEMASRLGVTVQAVQRYERLGRAPSSSAHRQIVQKMAEEVGEVYP